MESVKSTSSMFMNGNDNNNRDRGSDNRVCRRIWIVCRKKRSLNYEEEEDGIWKMKTKP